MMDIGDIDFSNIDWGDIGRVRDYSDYSSAATGVSTGITLFSNLLSLAIIVLMIIALWKIFVKAGKPGWHAIIPFLNMYDLFIIAWKKKIGVAMLILSICNFVVMIAGVIMFIGGLGGSFISFFTSGYKIDNGISGPMTMFFVGLGLLLLGACISITCMVFMIINYVKLGKAFGKSGGFLVGLALIPIVFLCILAFGSAEYQGYWDQEGYHPPEPGFGPGYGPGYGGQNAGYYQAGPAPEQPYTPLQIHNEIPEPPRYCSGCGTQIVPGAKFCNNCGKQLVK